MDRITVYYTEDSPRVQIELPSEAERVQDIANQTAEFISSLSPAAYVVVEEAPPHIAQYITNGR